CLSIPLVYTVGRWPRGRRTRGRNWGWSRCSARGVGAATSGCRDRATQTVTSKDPRCARSARVRGGISRSRIDHLVLVPIWGGCHNDGWWGAPGGYGISLGQSQGLYLELAPLHTGRPRMFAKTPPRSLRSFLASSPPRPLCSLHPPTFLFLFVSSR